MKNQDKKTAAGKSCSCFFDNSDAFDYITKIISTDYNVMIGRNITEKFPLLPVTEEDINLAFTAVETDHKMLDEDLDDKVTVIDVNYKDTVYYGCI